MYQNYFIMATQPTEYVPPLFTMRENLNGINRLNLEEIKQMAFQQQDKRLGNGVAALFANKMEKHINVLDFSDLPPVTGLKMTFTRIRTRDLSSESRSSKPLGHGSSFDKKRIFSTNQFSENSKYQQCKMEFQSHFGNSHIYFIACRKTDTGEDLQIYIIFLG